jgi:hypothetical protein
VAIRFIGSDGHGVVHADPAEVRRLADPRDWHLRLARMASPVPSHLQPVALDNPGLEIPAAGLDLFRGEYYPRLRQSAAVVSSDGAFAPPEIPAPVLVLRVGYGPGQVVDLDWEWEYRVGEARRRVPLYPAAPDDGYRDVGAERASLAGLDLPLEEFGLAGPDPDQPLAPSAELHGIDTMRFTAELLPLLADRPGIAVEVNGERADYRAVDDTLSIGVSTDEVAGDTDWFDLGITLTVEGRQIPFTDVFVALSQEQSHLLLADGAYFSLDKPELRELRRLIEEARTLAAQLRPYQLDGFGWLAFLWQQRLGGILADDMGLGKTLQSLALICHARQTNPGLAPFLIVAPTSVVANWAAEAARFTPGLRVVAVTDTPRRRGQTLHDTVAGADVVVTSYTLFRLDADAYTAIDWAGLILDEAQFVKNHQAKTYQCVRQLPAQFELAITGTPMENNLMELWSLLSITCPGLFPHPTRFREYYAQPIEKHGDTELLARLRRRIKPLIKRRTKEQVATDLPAKQEQVLEVDLHPRHRKIYQTRLQRERQKVLSLVDDLTTHRFTILRSLTVLRQLSLHAGLVDDTHHDLPSAKIDAVLEQLDDVVHGGHRALVFSQFTGFLRHVRARLDAAGTPYCYLDGRTRNRDAVLPLPRRRCPRLPDQPQGRRLRPQPHRGRLLLPARPLVEPRHRGTSHRPHPPHRPDPQRHGLPPHRPQHHRGEGPGTPGPQGPPVRQRHGRRQPVRRHPHRRRHPRTAHLNQSQSRGRPGFG